MSDEILKKLDALGTKSVSRRSFLRGGALAAGVVAAGAALPAVLRAQEPQQQPPQQQQPKTDDQTKDGDKASGDASTETKLDADGREYRSCPQCGSNMYRQGRTWTCENCGYSYVE